MYNFARKSSFRKIAALKKLGTLKHYKSTRDYTPEELENEIGEYFENEITHARFPDLANTPDELREIVKNAPKKYLTEKELKSLDNSDVADYIDKPNAIERVKRMASEYGRKVESIFQGIEAGEEFPLPIVIEQEEELYLMAGNTRLCVFAVKRMTLPVKIIKHP